VGEEPDESTRTLPPTAVGPARLDPKPAPTSRGFAPGAHELGVTPGASDPVPVVLAAGARRRVWPVVIAAIGLSTVSMAIGAAGHALWSRRSPDTTSGVSPSSSTTSRATPATAANSSTSEATTSTATVPGEPPLAESPWGATPVKATGDQIAQAMRYEIKQCPLLLPDNSGSDLDLVAEEKGTGSTEDGPDYFAVWLRDPQRPYEPAVTFRISTPAESSDLRSYFAPAIRVVKFRDGSVIRIDPGRGGYGGTLIQLPGVTCSYEFTSDSHVADSYFTSLRRIERSV
jgi:hypothetical protein